MHIKQRAYPHNGHLRHSAIEFTKSLFTSTGNLGNKVHVPLAVCRSVSLLILVLTTLPSHAHPIYTGFGELIVEDSVEGWLNLDRADFYHAVERSCGMPLISMNQEVRLQVLRDYVARHLRIHYGGQSTGAQLQHWRAEQDRIKLTLSIFLDARTGEVPVLANSILVEVFPMQRTSIWAFTEKDTLRHTFTRSDTVAGLVF